MARRVFSALVCATLLLSVASAGGEAAKEEGKKGAEHETAELEKLPDPEHPINKKWLQCTVCQSTILEVGKRFKPVHRDFDRQLSKLRGYHLSAALEELCDRESLHYGLLREEVRNKKPPRKMGKAPGPKFTHEGLTDDWETHTKIYPRYVDETRPEFKDKTVKGEWVTSRWRFHCEELMERYEDEWLDIFKGTKKPDFCPICSPLIEEEKKQKAEAEGRKKTEEDAAKDMSEKEEKMKAEEKVLEALENKMPDPEHPINKKWLQCTICQTTLEEVDKRFKPVHRKLDRQLSKLRGYHLSAALEQLCEKESLHYGLLREEDNTKVYPRYVDASRPEFEDKTVTGGWVTNRWRSHCEELMEKYEDEWLAIFKGTKKPEFCPVCKPLIEEEKKRQAEAESRKKAEEEAAGKDTTEDL